MYLVYSIVLSIGFLLMLPLFLLRREKYAAGSDQRFGKYPPFEHDGRKVIWLHCVSVGETNAARPLVDAIIKNFPDHRLVVSTTTKTGQELAGRIFAGKADRVFYFPFEWKFSVLRALKTYKPSAVLLMETEIWPRFIREAKRTGAKVAIVNGRLSQRSADRYRMIRPLMRAVLKNVDRALMQSRADADRISQIGIDPAKVFVTGNLKFEQDAAAGEITESIRRRFALGDGRPLIIAASTHDPEERYILESLTGELGTECRLMIVPRHPERFDDVARLLGESGYKIVRRSSPEADADRTADIILLDSIGELRAVYPLADIVFVGGSLIPHGGQNVIEPAFEGKAIVTGPHTMNFASVMEEFLKNNAIRQLPAPLHEAHMPHQLREQLKELLRDKNARIELGRRAAAVVESSDRDAVKKTIEFLRPLIEQDSIPSA